jgi:hypothetical protein
VTAELSYEFAFGTYEDALSLNPWMGDFVWSLTRFPERRPGMGTVAYA